MAGFEDAVKALEGLEGGSDLVEAIHEHMNGEIAKEKRTGLDFKKQFDKTDIKLRSLKKGLSGLGFNSDEMDVDDFFSDMQTKLSAPPSKGKKDKDFIISDMPEFKQLVKENKQLKSDFESSRESERKKQLKIDNAAISKKLMQSFTTDDGQQTHYGVPHKIENLILKGGVRVVDDNVVFVDSSDSDLTIDYDTGIKSFLTRSDIKADQKNIQKGGSGGGSSGGGSSDLSNDDRLAHLRNLDKNF